MKKEIWQEDQPVLKHNLNQAQTSKEEAVKERLTDTLSPGIVRDSQLFAETIPFEITVNTIPYSADIATGVAYDPTGERILVDNAAVTFDAAAPTSTTDNGIGGTTVTPQSTGSLAVPLTAGLVNYIFITYLQTTDADTFSLSNTTHERLFTTGLDGYKIEVVTDAGPAVSGTPNLFQPNANAVYLGAVDLDQILNIENRTFASLVEGTLVAEVPTPLETLNALGDTYNAGQSVSFREHVQAVGTGVPTAVNPHGLAINDLTGSLTGKTAEQHEELYHESGISSGQASTTSALYGSVVDSAGSPFIGPTFARDNFLIKKPKQSGQQNFVGNGVQVTFTLTGGLAFIPGSGNLRVYVNGELQATPSQYSEVGSTAVTFVAPPTTGLAVSLVVDGEGVQVNGTTISSAEISEDFLFYFVDAGGTFLDNGTYTIYLDAALGALRLAHSGSPANTAYRVKGVTTGTFTNANTISLAAATSNPNNFLLWQVDWDSTGFGLGNDNFANVVDKRVFGTVGSEALARDAETDTVTINHNLEVTGNATFGANIIGIPTSTLVSANGFTVSRLLVSLLERIKVTCINNQTVQIDVPLTGALAVIQPVVSGASGLDTGTWTTDTWYAVHLIFNDDLSLTNGVFSLSDSAPTLPAGYTISKRVGWVRADSATTLRLFVQTGDWWFWQTPYVTLASTTSAITTTVPPSSFLTDFEWNTAANPSVTSADMTVYPTEYPTMVATYGGHQNSGGSSETYNGTSVMPLGASQSLTVANNGSITIRGYYDPI